MTTVGFIGLGSQGGPMARRIVDAGIDTVLWARRPETLEPFADSAAKTAGSPAEVGAASDIVCLCVVGDDDVLSVAGGPDGVLSGMREGAILVVHSTVHPDTCTRLAAEAAARGVSVVDAPVSGGGRAAEAGNLLVMVGGDEETVAACRPVFGTYGDPVVHLGPLGSGQVTKLLNNLLFTANLATSADTLALGKSLGVDADRLAQVITNGSANSFALGRVASAGGLERIAGHAGNVLVKDVSLIDGIAATAGARSEVVQATAHATLRLMGLEQ
ncbi:NAD-binding protein [Gordonia amarae]|uniref:NAD-binding protein n=2 Tax=Gordonia amarae TaxID=36821 RepID=A0A857LKI1_9ACTN|nr:NAD(P)-dependent oxidoreductase [Gordonia amarae]MCS3877751.1 3-hydroxyisobutyrate dehydrogenase-like beta-hydroxyacid dehydrogenase [Gordonia amarae]QHN16450.1 NAD-binding protein [Gordonia amarae]QHN21019.1 NAD-binding protein [Gordonia amarae]QHN29871.1 NAD-binding protein [Gordonia amarae]QHN38646.1 NAD-binding protein [Gordonia amarae]